MDVGDVCSGQDSPVGTPQEFVILHGHRPSLLFMDITPSNLYADHLGNQFANPNPGWGKSSSSEALCYSVHALDSRCASRARDYCIMN